MNVTSGGDGGGDEDVHTSSALTNWTHTVSQRYQHLLDKSTPYVRHRWIGFGVVLFIYVLRVSFVQGYYIVTYGLGIYILQLFITFLSPQVDPEFEEDPFDGLALPTHGSEEFRPFVRRLPEFKFWCVPHFDLILVCYLRLILLQLAAGIQLQKQLALLLC